MYGVLMLHMIDNEKGLIVREIMYSRKGGGELRKLTIRIVGPRALTAEEVNFEVTGDMAICNIIFDGIDKSDEIVYGVDNLQALSIAIDLNGYLKSLTNKYDFYWKDGDPYFI
jgi:hypothetical protein